jgi:hypothetical protein
MVSSETLEKLYANRVIKLTAAACLFAWVHADASQCPRKWDLFSYYSQSFGIFPLGGEIYITWYVYMGWTGLAAWDDVAFPIRDGVISCLSID